MSGDLEGARAQAGEAAALALGLDDPAVDATLALTQGFIAQAEADVGARRRVLPNRRLGLATEVTSTRSFTCPGLLRVHIVQQRSNRGGKAAVRGGPGDRTASR